MTDNMLDRNLLSLSLHNKEAAAELTKGDISDRIRFKVSKTNLIVPVFEVNGREYSLHSMFDPAKEAQRYADSIKGGGYIVVFGLGAGYHIKALLEKPDVNGILIIEKDIDIIKKILTRIDMSDIFSDSRISLLIDKTSEFISDYLPSNYLPAVTGDFRTLQLRSRVESEKEYFLSIFTKIQDVLDTLSDDYTVQTWFGKRWFINSISNLKAAEKSFSVLRPQKNICIAAAGPSLEIHLDHILSHRDESYLISTDTALSCLLKNSIVPDLVISIDCQHITYHHFMAGYPREIPLVMDLASPRYLTGLSDNVIFFTSGHPFSRYVNRNWRKFPYVDTSGGNVTHAAISLADSLGARNIYIYGADFSYPEGKSYARGTYIYPYFSSRNRRVKPIESSFYDFLYRNDNIRMIKTDYGYRYNTRPMISYKERLEIFSGEINARIIPVGGLGETINVYKKEKNVEAFPLFSAGSSRSGWKDFLNAYGKRLESLPVLETNPAVYFSKLEYTDKDIWTTLFPVAAVFRKKYKHMNIDSSFILNEVRIWALDIIKKYLD